MIDIKPIYIDFKNDAILSYTQYSLYASCPKRWELAYGRNLRSRETNIHFIFGHVIHKTLQSWIESIYNNVEFDVYDYYEKIFLRECKDAASKFNDLSINSNDLMTFYEGGKNILKHVNNNNFPYFDTDVYELLGIEIPIYISIFDENEHVKLLAYVDIAFKDKRNGIIELIDIKTSTRPWSHYQYADEIKMSQVLLYRIYYSKMYDVPIDDILVKYYILSRDVTVDDEYVVEYVPDQNNLKCDTFQMEFETFVDTVIDDRGNYRLDINYPAIGGQNYSNCKFCEFANNEELCPKSNRII